MGSKDSNRSGGLRGCFGVVATLAALLIVASAQQPAARKTTINKQQSALRQRDTSAIAPTIPTANRYQKDRVFLEHANALIQKEYTNYQIVTGDVQFRKADMYMYCDSAHFYDNPGAIEAFGNVRMEQGDTLFVFGDELFYSDSTQLATLYSYPLKEVRLINKDVTLTTDVFNYDLGIELGYYETGGVLTDRDNKLTSIYGEYSPSSKDALFRSDVHLTSLSDNDTLEIFTEEMLYNTMTHIAILDTTSTILATDGTIYTTQGIYNTETSQADLYRRSLVVASNGNTLTGDTLYYDRKLGFGEGYGNIELTDTTHKMILNGDYGFYFEMSDSAMVTGRALAREYSSSETGDTLYLHSDTIRTFVVITPETMANDSVTVPADTTHYLVAAPHVRFYRTDLQGLCDSMAFVQRDSMLYMHYHPIIWNEEKQIFGNEVKIHLNDSTVEWAELPDFGFMAEWLDEEFYNQLTGKTMMAYFTAGTLSHLDVSGNVQAIMLPEENDSTFNKIANVESSYLAADFKNQTIEKMKLWPETNGTMTPLYLAKKSLFYLPQFQWFGALRPVSPEDVFNISAEMLSLMEEPPFGARTAARPAPKQQPTEQPSDSQQQTDAIKPEEQPEEAPSEQPDSESSQPEPENTVAGEAAPEKSEDNLSTENEVAPL